MFDGRIYRAAFVPLLFVLVIVGFSLTGRSAPLSSTLAPEAFDGARAFADLQSLTKRYPDRQPGDEADDRLAAEIAATLRGLSGGGGQSASSAAHGGFQVSTRLVHAQTIDGARTLTTVIAQRPGSSNESPIVIVAHRDAPGRGAAAELSGTAALIELAHVFSQSETRRTIVLVSTSGGSGGYAGAVDFAQQSARPLDAAIVLGDLAGSAAHKPFVLSYSSVAGTAPESLQLTLGGAISQEVGTSSGAPGTVAQFVHLALPLTTGEQAPLNASGIPAVLVQVSGERGPLAGEAVSEARLQNFGRSVLSAVYALDEGPNIPAPSPPHFSLGRRSLPGWAVRLFVFALLLPPLLVCVDALARLRRRREPVSRWVLWTLAAALPFFVCGMFAILLGRLAIVAAPGGQLPGRSLSADGSGLAAVLATTLVLVLALAAWPAFVRRIALPLRPSTDGAGLAVLLVLLALALLIWLINPFTCLLLVPALHLWLFAVSPDLHARRRGRALALLAVLAGVLPFVLLLIAYSHELAIGLGGLAESVVLVFVGGQVGLFGGLLWSVAFGCLLAVTLRVLAPSPADSVGRQEWVEVSTRGPASYAGPGSLGGTESALRR
jgi:Peptidase family M28